MSPHSNLVDARHFSKLRLQNALVRIRRRYWPSWRARSMCAFIGRRPKGSRPGPRMRTGETKQAKHGYAGN